MSHSKVFVVIGAESSGKTTLATQLCDSLQAPLVTEVSREYLTQKLSEDSSFNYQQQDLLSIAKHQHSLETSVLATNPNYAICDTDLLVIIIWSEIKYGCCDPWITETFEKTNTHSSSRHYLLCDWDIPWQADKLRENPHDRSALFEKYRRKLEKYKLSYTHVKGNQQQRLQQSLRLQNP